MAVAECRVTWIDEDAGRRDAWERLSAVAGADGYDPAPIWPNGPTGDGFVALRLDPGALQKSAAAMAAGEPYLVWEAAGQRRSE